MTWLREEATTWGLDEGATEVSDHSVDAAGVPGEAHILQPEEDVVTAIFKMISSSTFL